MYTDRNIAEETIDTYNDLRDRCYEAARRDEGELMGGDKWLRHAFDRSDLNLQAHHDGINCFGNCRSSQTQDIEYFDFTIPYEVL